MGRYLEFIKTYRLLHRNSQKRIIFPDAVYFATSNTFNRHPFFKESLFCDLFVKNLRLCKRLKGFRLFAWFLGYDHFHLQIMPDGKWNISKIMQFLKRHINRDINFLLYPEEGGIRESRLRGTIRESRLRGTIRESRLRGGRYEYLQSVIHKHDKKLISFQLKFKQKYPNGHKFPPFHWQESFHDHVIRSGRDFDNHMEYIANNPIKHNMPNDCLRTGALVKAWPYVYTNPDYEDLIDECL